MVTCAATHHNRRQRVRHSHSKGHSVGLSAPNEHPDPVNRRPRLRGLSSGHYDLRLPNGDGQKPPSAGLHPPYLPARSHYRCPVLRRLVAALDAAAKLDQPGCRLGHSVHDRLRDRHRVAMGMELSRDSQPERPSVANRRHRLVPGPRRPCRIGDVAPCRLAKQRSGSLRDGPDLRDRVANGHPGDDRSRRADPHRGPLAAEAVPPHHTVAGTASTTPAGPPTRRNRIGAAAVGTVEWNSGERLLRRRQPNLRPPRHRHRRGNLTARVGKQVRQPGVRCCLGEPGS